MKSYNVSWEIDDLDADSPLDAAKQALAIHRDPSSMATCFTVTDEHGTQFKVDLMGEEGNQIVDIIDNGEHVKIGTVCRESTVTFPLALSYLDLDGKRCEIGTMNFMFDVRAKASLDAIWFSDDTMNVDIWAAKDEAG